MINTFAIIITWMVLILCLSWFWVQIRTYTPISIFYQQKLSARLEVSYADALFFYVSFDASYASFDVYVSFAVFASVGVVFYLSFFFVFYAFAFWLFAYSSVVFLIVVSKVANLSYSGPIPVHSSVFLFVSFPRTGVFLVPLAFSTFSLTLSSLSLQEVRANAIPFLIVFRK